jgi:hypothetical protein
MKDQGACLPNLPETHDFEEDAALPFTTGAGIPVTNNLAERPVGIIKDRARISWHFRSRERAVCILWMRSFLDTFRKRGIGHYKSITMRGGAKIPEFITEALSRKAESTARKVSD